jgi:predicted PurR-regulated permease PerM
MDFLDDLDPGRVGLVAFGLFLVAIGLFVVLSFLGVFVLGVFLYYATRPFYRRFDTYVPSSAAAACSLAMLAVPTVILLGYTAAVGYQELVALAQTYDIAALDSLVGPGFDVADAIRNPQTLLESAGTGTLTSVADALVGSLGLILSSLLDIFVALTLAFYLLRDGGRLRTLLENYLVRHSEVLDRSDRLDDYFDAIDSDLETVFFGNILNAIVIAIIGAIAFSVLNVFAPATHAIPYPALLGILAGAASLVPVVGMKIVYVPVIGYLGAQSAVNGTGWAFLFAFVFVAAVVVDFVPDMALRPLISGGDLHVGTVMFAYIFGPLVFGWYGLFLGPLLLVLGVHFYRIVLAIEETEPAGEAADHDGRDGDDADGDGDGDADGPGDGPGEGSESPAA